MGVGVAVGAASKSLRAGHWTAWNRPRGPGVQQRKVDGGNGSGAGGEQSGRSVPVAVLTELMVDHVLDHKLLLQDRAVHDLPTCGNRAAEHRSRRRRQSGGGLVPGVCEEADGEAGCKRARQK